MTQVTQELYAQLIADDIEVLLDDREGYRPGVKFIDSELIGVPFRLVIGERGLEENVVELTTRRSGETQKLPLASAAQNIKEIVKMRADSFSMPNNEIG